jgi:hypothetical protein
MSLSAGFPCPKCRSTNTTVRPASYGERVAEHRTIIGLPVVLVLAALDRSLKIFECKDCGAAYETT